MPISPTAGTAPTSSRRSPISRQGFDPTTVPEDGTWVQVSFRDNTRQVGRIVFCDVPGSRLRVRYGAGYWDFPFADISHVNRAVDPRTRMTAPKPNQQVVVVDLDD